MTEQLSQIELDLLIYGVSYMKDGERIEPKRVVVVDGINKIKIKRGSVAYRRYMRLSEIDKLRMWAKTRWWND